MSDNDLQRLTECVSDIGQASSRRSLPSRRSNFTQKLHIANEWTLYISIHNDPFPRETIALYDTIAYPMSVQSDASIEKVGDLLTGTKLVICRPVLEHGRLKHCSRLPDLIVRHPWTSTTVERIWCHLQSLEGTHP